MKLSWALFASALTTLAVAQKKPISNVASFSLDWPKLYTAIVPAPGTESQLASSAANTYFVADIDFLSVKETGLPSPYDGSGSDFMKISFMVHSEVELRHLEKLTIINPSESLSSNLAAHDTAHAFNLEVDTFLTAKFQDELKPSADNANYGAQNQNFETISGFPCYKNVAGSFAWMEHMVNRANSIENLSITLEDIGDSYLKSQNSNNGYDIKVLKVTGNGVEAAGRTTEKGVLFMMTGLHARELAPTELLSRWVESMVDGYGTDAEKTSILDHTVIHFVMQANPDGRNDAEVNMGNYRRKNMNPSGGSSCSAASTGVDLNRNWPFKWGFGNGSSNNKCDQTYRGLSPASEPEVQAIVDYCLEIFPEEQRKNNPEQDKQVPFADTARGIFMDTHSYSEIIIWPWGHEELATGNDSQMEALVAKFRHFNGYGFSGPGNGFLYEASGVSDDWAYGVLGAAGFTFELGTTFYQQCSYFEGDILPKNLPALTYAAKSATMPYRIPLGPDVFDVSTSSVDEDSLRIQLTASDSEYSSSNHESSRQGVKEVRAFLNIHPDDEEDGQSPLGSVINNGQNPTIIDISSLDYGKHTVYFQAEDSAGFLGPVTAAYFIKNDPDNPLPTMSPTTPAPAPLPCTDDPENWHDADGPTYDCDWYSQGTNCEQYGDDYENMGKTANEACCDCGGGLIGTAQPVATPAPVTTPAPTRPPTPSPTRPPTPNPTRAPTKNPTPPPVAPTPDNENWIPLSSIDFEDQNVGIFVPKTVNKIKKGVAYDNSTWSMRIKKKQKAQTKKITVKRYSKIKVEFMYRPVRTESNDYFKIQTKFNGEGWKDYDAFGSLTNDQWKMGTTIIEGFGAKRDLRIRFFSQQDEGNDNIFIDNVEIYGMA